MKKETQYNNNYFYVIDIETGKYGGIDAEYGAYHYDEETGEETGYLYPVATWLSYGWIKKYNTSGETLDKRLFRTWSELNEILIDINLESINYTTLIYIHSLSFEGDFIIKNIGKVKKFLSNSAHRFICAKLEKLDGIEFRCSYMLTGLKLSKLGEKIGLNKLEDDYKSYLPSEDIPESSLAYCERDCDIVAKLISIMIRDNGRLNDIPLTKTALVRKMIEERYDLEKDKKSIVWDLLPPEEHYDLYRKATIGGTVMTNPLYNGVIIDNVISCDRNSSYIYEALNQRYPYKFERPEEEIWSINQLKDYKHYIATFRATRLRSRYPWAWLSIEKCEQVNSEYKDNNGIKDHLSIYGGKVYYANEIEFTLNDIDFETFNKTYECESLEIVDIIVSNEDMELPRCIRYTIEKLAEDKNKIKEKRHLGDYEYEYEISKIKLNGVIGCMIQKLEHEDFVIDEFGIWDKIPKEYKQTKKHIKRNYLFGLYCLSYARKSLIDCILINCPYNFLYCDTDSVKYQGDIKDFKDTNVKSEKYKDNKYIYEIGSWEYEETYKEFVYLGSKQYAYRDSNNNIEMRVSGLPRDNKVNNLEEFVDGKIFENCKLGSFYITKDKRVIAGCDGVAIAELDEDMREVSEFYKLNNMRFEGGVALGPVGYRLSISERDKRYIKYIKEREDS